MKPTDRYSAFISYASESREKADQLCASLEARGLACWMAPRNVRAGREYADEIILGLEASAAVVLLLSEASNTSVFVLREIERAVAKDINVVPVRIEEVTPSPGLELFISGTHWLDVWKGDWDEHMDKLVRDLSDGPVAPLTPGTMDEHRSVAPGRSLRTAYVSAAIALVVVLSGIAGWSLSRATSPQAEPAGRPEVAPTTDAIQGPPVANPAPVSTTSVSTAPVSTASVSTAPVSTAPVSTASVSPASSNPPVSPAPRPRTPPSSGEQTSRQIAPSAPAATSTAPPAREASSALNALRDDYDNLSVRGDVIDETLNQLWEDMKPNSPRIDMLTHQRSLKTNLTRSREALAERDAAEARRYLDNVRTDLAVLEQFLNR